VDGARNVTFVPFVLLAYVEEDRLGQRSRIGGRDLVDLPLCLL